MLLVDNPSPRVRVLLVDDSPVELEIIRRTLAADPGIEVVGTAVNGEEGLKQVRLLRPDVVCTDYHMPVMDGLAFTQRVMAEFPCPILVLSISAQPHQAKNILMMIQAGAIDVMAKPLASDGGVSNLDGRRLAEKVKILRGVHCIPLRQRKAGASLVSVAEKPGSPVPSIIGIGSSTGGPQALAAILPNLPRGFPAALVCAQHISKGFLDGLIQWLAETCALPVRLAAPGSKPQPGHIYFAPEGGNLYLDSNGVFQMSAPSDSDIYIPNIDVLLSSIARVYGERSAGVLLSGMGRDGVIGLRDIRANGGKTLVQDKASCIVFGMPGAAIEAGVVDNVLPLDLIGSAISNLCQSSKE